jgi:hypothetical protein
MDIDTEYAAKVAKINDGFRDTGFGVTLTVGVQALDDLQGLLSRVRSYSDFNEDNDPWMEHDFGSLKWQGEKVFWKISYYDQALEYGEDPLSLKCRRVLTVMLASEY